MIKCPSCGKKEALIVPKSELEKRGITALGGVNTFADPGSIIAVAKLLAALAVAGKALFGWLQEREKTKQAKMKDRALICQACGHMEDA